MASRRTQSSGPSIKKTPAKKTRARIRETHTLSQHEKDIRAAVDKLPELLMEEFNEPVATHRNPASHTRRTYDIAAIQKKDRVIILSVVLLSSVVCAMWFLSATRLFGSWKNTERSFTIFSESKKEFTSLMSSLDAKNAQTITHVLDAEFASEKAPAPPPDPSLTVSKQLETLFSQTNRAATEKSLPKTQ